LSRNSSLKCIPRKEFQKALEFIFSWIDIEDGIVLQQENPKNLLPFSLGGWKFRRGSSICSDVGKLCLQFLSLHIWRRNDFFLKFLFFSWVDMEDEIVVQEKNPRNLLPFFLGRRNCKRGSNVHVDTGTYFLQFLNLHI
jgi:hypothetical protein